MSKKKKPDNKGFVYSTDPDFQFEQEEENNELPEPSRQKLRVRLDTRHRAGKSVTLITGFIGPAKSLEELGRQLRSVCGTGGSAKEGEIIVQGDQRKKILEWLVKNGYGQTKISG